MLRELMNVFRGKHPEEHATQDFNRMLELSREMILEACEVYWGREFSPEERTRLYDQDVQLNKLQRTVRKHVVEQLSGPVPANVPWGLLLMSLVKDVERIGDYAKNLTELSLWCPGPMPEDDIAGELREITRAVTSLAKEAPDVFQKSDAERARELVVEGRTLSRRCDELVRKVAGSGYSAEQAVKMAVGARFLKRVEGHLLNLLTAVIMPLHKLDYYAEAALSG